MLTSIGHYNIITKIASGGMANIYLALDPKTNTKVAIKVLKEEVSDKEKILERFKQEGLLNLNHENIVKILDAGVHDNTPYIVMEYIEGHDLEDLIKANNKLPVNEALSIFSQLLSALSYVHSLHIIHRDIKPKNILIDKSGKVKLTDFGIAKSLYSHVKTSTRGYLGAPAYSSPEQMDGAPVDSRSDIYSLGITLYEMLLGVTPFSSTSIPNLIKEKFSGTYRQITSYRQDVPPHIISIISKCIAVSPKDRFGSVIEIVDALSRPEDTQTLTIGPKPASPTKKLGLVFSIIVAVMLAVIIILAVKLSSKAENIVAAVTETTAMETIKPGVLTVGGDTTWPPMEYVEGDKIVGFDVDLTQAIADKIGLKLDYQSAAWDGLFPALISHKYDMAISSITITDERKKEMDFSNPYYKTDQAVTVKEDSGIDTVEKMDSKTAGAQIGTTGEIVSKNIKGCTTNTYDDILMAFEDLKAGRIDAVICDSYLGYSYSMKNKGFKVGFVITTNEKLGIAFAKDTPVLLAAVNGALKTLMDDGTYDSIYEKWFGTKPPKLATTAPETNAAATTAAAVTITETTAESILEKTDFNIGDTGPAGGMIFYVNPNYKNDGWHYLEAAPGDQGTQMQWDNGSNVATGATATAVGTGQANTQTIVKAQGSGSYAAQLCNDLTLGGYSDWFLPSKDELNLMYENLEVAGLGGFTSDSYWSSSEYSADDAWYKFFYSGNQGNGTKYYYIRVRAVRAF